MMSTDTPTERLSNVPIFSVGELSHVLKKSIEQQFSFVRIRGEVSGFKRHTNRHTYFTLKDNIIDSKAVLNAVIWNDRISMHGPIPMTDGVEVICTGRLTTYADRSSYQLVVEAWEIAGEGALLKQLEMLKKKLLAEGLFDSARKKQLPRLPRTIAVVTSPTGAVIRDILHRIRQRCPAHVIVWPVVVQGQQAAPQVIAAIEQLQQPHNFMPQPDLIIVARGGGSLEDLWPFNDEQLVRVVANCRIPIISAIGHETDTTLIDLAADVRAPTPTAAAEMAVPVRSDLLQQLQLKQLALSRWWSGLQRPWRLRLDHVSKLWRQPERLLQVVRQRLDDVGNRLVQPQQLLNLKRGEFSAVSQRHVRAVQVLIRDGTQRLGFVRQRLSQLGMRLIEPYKQPLISAARLLSTLSYERTLERGFALVHAPTKQIVGRADVARSEQTLTIQFVDGEVAVSTLSTASATAPPRRRKSPPSSSTSPDLFGDSSCKK